MVDLNHLMELDRIARANAADYHLKRDLFEQILNEKGNHAAGIVGPRGVGKTVLLKQLAGAIENSFYLSADILDDDDIFTIAKSLQERLSISVLLLDEIHTARDFRKSLKKIFDFLHLRVIFTSSVSLSLFESATDLSRRVRLSWLYPFSFREFIKFKTGLELPRLTLSDIRDKKWTSHHLRQADLFDAYLHGSIMPFALEEPDVIPLLHNVVGKVISSDVPSVTPLRTNELHLMTKCLEFIGRSSVDGINYSSLSRNIGITRYKAHEYVDLLEKAFILQVVYPRGANVLIEPKVLMGLPYRLLYSPFETAIGGLREDFFIETMRMTGTTVHYLKSTRGAKTPDFLVQTDGGEIIVEIGGRSKGREQFKGMENKKKELILTHSNDTDGMRRPLFLAGFL